MLPPSTWFGAATSGLGPSCCCCSWHDNQQRTIGQCAGMTAHEGFTNRHPIQAQPWPWKAPMPQHALPNILGGADSCMDCSCGPQKCRTSAAGCVPHLHTYTFVQRMTSSQKMKGRAPDHTPEWRQNKGGRAASTTGGAIHGAMHEHAMHEHAMQVPQTERGHPCTSRALGACSPISKPCMLCPWVRVSS